MFESSLYEVIHSISNLFEKYNIETCISYKEERIILRGNIEMKDAGFETNNVLLDIFIERKMNIIFIGLLRVPKDIRETGLGKKVVEIIKHYADYYNSIILVDSCETANIFWKKQSFKPLLMTKQGFEIMSYNNNNLNTWNEFKCTSLFDKYLSYYR